MMPLLSDNYSGTALFSLDTVHPAGPLEVLPSYAYHMTPEERDMDRERPDGNRCSRSPLRPDGRLVRGDLTLFNVHHSH